MGRVLVVWCSCQLFAAASWGSLGRFLWQQFADTIRVVAVRLFL
jgi:hypothetical protein